MPTGSRRWKTPFFQARAAKAMRLRTRLSLAFAFLALLPLALVVPWALNNLRQTLSRGFDVQMETATRATQSILRTSGEASSLAVAELSEGWTGWPEWPS